MNGDKIKFGRKVKRLCSLVSQNQRIVHASHIARRDMSGYSMFYGRGAVICGQGTHILWLSSYWFSIG